MIHLQLQSYSKATKWTKGQEEMEMGGRVSKRKSQVNQFFLYQEERKNSE